MNKLERIQQWYASQCNGDWEHQHGIHIESLDNPGWTVSVDLDETSLESITIDPYKHDNGQDDWIVCEVRDKKFIGNGDPSKLTIILDRFANLLSMAHV